MNYISTKEAAEKWGLHPTRVTLLARQGRINGALQKGREWLIPADAVKPNDRRKPAAEKDDRPFFPFYYYQMGGEYDDRSKLDGESQQLYDAQKCYVIGDIETCAQITDKLISDTKNRYILIGALYTRCNSALELMQTKIFDAGLCRMRDLFKEDFPYKNELKCFLDDLESFGQGSWQWVAEFSFGPDCVYSKEMAPCFVVNIVYAALVKLCIHSARPDTSLMEVSCAGLDESGEFFPAQLVHVFLSGIYFIEGERKNSIFHLRKALDIALEHDSYYPLAIAYNYMGSIYDVVVPEYPQEVCRKLEQRSKRYHDGVRALYKMYSAYTVFQKLTRRDYEYIMYALKKKSNAVVAQLKGLTPPTVSKYYSRLCAKMGVENKKQLTENFRYIVTNGSGAENE